MFKKQKKQELTVDEQLNIKLNKEKLARAGFGYVTWGFHEIVLNKMIYVPDNMLKLSWEDLKKDLLKQSAPFDVALKQRLEV